MSESQSLQTYKSLVDVRLEELSTHLKSNIGLYQGTNLPDVSEIVSRFFNSAEVELIRADVVILENQLENDDKVIALEYSKSQANIMFMDIDEYGKLKLFENIIKELKQNPPRPSSRSRSYDQVVKGDVKIVEIKNNSEYSHRITFHKIGKFLLYQIWDPKGTVKLTHLPSHPSNLKRPTKFNEAKKYAEDNPDKVAIVDYQINEDRDVVLKTGKEWVLFFNKIPDFTPTTVMEIGYKKYIFVIKKAEINKNDKVVFYISMKEIQLDKKLNKMKKLKKIPTGKYKNVRFDVDCDGSGQGNSSGSDSCPAGYNISSWGVYGIAYCIKACDPGYDAGGGINNDVCYGQCQDWGGCSLTCGCCNFWGGWRGSLLEPCHHPECVSSYVPNSIHCMNNACDGDDA